MSFLTVFRKLAQGLHASCSNILILVIEVIDDSGDNIVSYGIVLPHFHYGTISFYTAQN